MGDWLMVSGTHRDFAFIIIALILSVLIFNDNLDDFLAMVFRAFCMVSSVLGPHTPSALMKMSVFLGS